jgi:hypothetical protein
LAEAKSSAAGIDGGVDWAFAAIEHKVAIAATMTVLGIVTPLSC